MNGRWLTQKEIDGYKIKLKNMGYLILEEYRNKRNTMSFSVEDTNGYKHIGTAYSLLTGKSSIVNISNPFTLYNISLWLKNNNKEFQLISEEYIKHDEKLLFCCNTCNNIFYLTWMELSRGCECPFCMEELGKRGTRKPTDETIRKYVESVGYFIVDENYVYHNSKDRVNLKDDDGYLYNIEISSIHQCIRKNTVLERFHKQNPFSLDNIYLWVNKNNRPYTIKEGEYISTGGKTFLLVCKNCFSEWTSSWANMLRGCNCPYCGHVKVKEENSLGAMFPFLEKEWDYEKNSKSPFLYSIGSSQRAFWICSNCGNKWNSVIASRTKLQAGCPNCSPISIGNELTKKFFSKNKIDFIPEYRFDDCKDKNPLPFDFAVFDNGLLYLIIEVDGIQHFKPVKWFGGEKRFISLQKHDEIKNKYCIDNNIPILRISYLEFDNIENILESRLSPLLIERR